MNFDLVRPSVLYQESFLEAVNELPEEDQAQFIYILREEAKDIRNNFAKYVQALLDLETKPPAPLVCDTVYWAVNDATFLGRISFRHELNDFLRNVGGHIGFAVRPSFRNLGLASQMLSRVLKTERALALKEVLVTCFEDNVPSRKIIEKNGGLLSGSFKHPEEARNTLQFWIKTGPKD
jgi:predicted acetyltransferase